MPLVRRSWTPEDADEWSREDYWALLFSSLAYLLITLGTALVFVKPLVGVVATGLGIAAAWVMYYIIDPKLRTISLEYETRQKEYLDELEKIMKWEER